MSKKFFLWTTAVVLTAVVLSACAGDSQSQVDALSTQVAAQKALLEEQGSILATLVAQDAGASEPVSSEVVVQVPVWVNLPTAVAPIATATPELPVAAPTQGSGGESTAGGLCAAYKVDFTDPDPQHPGYRIDVGSPHEREVVNLWQRGGLEVTYIMGTMPVIRDFQVSSFGNMWMFPESCPLENLAYKGILYAKETGPENHTGLVYFVHDDGSLTLVTNDAFGYDLTVVPEDPTAPQ